MTWSSGKYFRLLLLKHCLQTCHHTWTSRKARALHCFSAVWNDLRRRSQCICVTDGGRLKFSMSPIVTDEIFLFMYLFTGYLTILSAPYNTQSRIEDERWKYDLERAWKEAAMPETEIGSMLVHLLWGTEEFMKKCSQDGRFQGWYF
jgi:hypothetical protein